LLAVAHQVNLLAALDQGATLWQIYEAIQEVDSWFGVLHPETMATHLSHMPSSNIAKLLRIRKEKVSPNSFMTYYGLNWPKETDPFKDYYTMKLQHFPLFQSLLANLRK
jgi:hypothetical protein